MTDIERIQLAHGGGGKLTDTLIQHVILKHLPLPKSGQLLDSAILETGERKLAFTTDSYVVSPIFFPGGDIGKLAICGTCNDLAMVGAVPKWISLGLIIEEGLPINELDRVLTSVAKTAHDAGVSVVTGDTKVVGKGQADGLFINTSGIGLVLPNSQIGFDRIEEGDVVIISGTIADHGLSIMAVREGMEFTTTITSDVACISPLANELIINLGPDVKFMRDPTRGGLAGVLADVSEISRHDLHIDETNIPILPSVQSAADILGLDCLSMANEGKFVAVVKNSSAANSLEILKNNPLGNRASIIGMIQGSSNQPKVILKTKIGGTRIVQKPYGEQLPRIC
jgi:hydrogenase expression/formation protein HypE